MCDMRTPTNPANGWLFNEEDMIFVSGSLSQAMLDSMRSEIVEPLNRENYIAIVVNVMWVVENHTGPFTNWNVKTTMICRVLDNIDCLNLYTHDHHRVITSMYKISAKHHQLNRFKYAYSEPECCSIL